MKTVLIVLAGIFGFFNFTLLSFLLIVSAILIVLLLPLSDKELLKSKQEEVLYISIACGITLLLTGHWILTLLLLGFLVANRDRVKISLLNKTNEILNENINSENQN